MKLIKNGRVILDYKTEDFVHLIISDGKIVDIVHRLPEETGMFDEIIDAKGKIVAPGLINGHTHSYANYFKTAADKLPLEEMMFYIMAEGDCLKPEDVYHNTILGAIEMVRGGITTCLDQLAQPMEGLEAAISAYDHIGMRATIAPMTSDMTYYDTLPINHDLLNEEQKKATPKSAQELLKTNVDFLKKWHKAKDRLYVGFGPSGPQRCTKELLQGSMKYANECDTIFHTHVLETRTQKNTAHLLFGKHMVEYLDEIGCLNDRVSMAHGVWITKEEAVLASSRGASVVHCPACNMYLGSGIAPVNMFREVGFNVGLGTDGPNGGCNQSMLETMKIAGLLHRPTELNQDVWISAAEAWKMATENNAKFLGLGNITGKIAKGMAADIVIYNPENSLALQPLHDTVMQLAFGETGSAVETVIIQGETVMLNGLMQTIDEKSVLQEVKKHGEIVTERLLAKKNKVEADVAFLKSILSRDF